MKVCHFLPFSNAPTQPIDARVSRCLPGKLITVTCLMVATLACLMPNPASGQGGVPQTNLVPIGPPQPNFPTTRPPSFAPSGPSTGGGFGNFDPYASPPATNFGGNPFGAGVNVTPIGPPTPIGSPTAVTPSPGGGILGGLFSRPASSPIYPGGFGGGTTLNGPIINAPPMGPPTYGGYDNANVYGPGSSGIYGQSPSGPAFPSNAFPSSSPTTLFPEGLFSGGGIFSRSNPSSQYSASRLFQGPRLRHTFVGFGDEYDDLSTNDTDVSLVFAFPNFFYSNQPLYVVPSFSLHLWDGPDNSTGRTNADLPGSAYSGFIDVGWNSDPNQMFSTEFGVRVGAFTDFDTFNDDSIRILGKAIANFRVTPTSTLKGGVYYLDRNTIKLVPAGGLLYQPNPYTRMDIFFPQPKFAQYFRTIGTRDVWWYVAGDYGGGSWTVKRDKGDDRVDIKEIRAVLGFEWGYSDMIRAGRRTGFFEIGYAFEREIESKRFPGDDLDLDDGVMFRLGIGY